MRQVHEGASGRAWPTRSSFGNPHHCPLIASKNIFRSAKTKYSLPRPCATTIAHRS